jgi:dTDP-4-dehydrorhamnose 3,5-epimerase
MNITATEIPGVLCIEPDAFSDARGTFSEICRVDRYAEFGVSDPFVQDNMSSSRQGVLRGLHLQYPRGQGKLVSAVYGEIFDVAVDARIGSPTFGRAVWVTLSESNRRQLYVPPGCAHGFAVSSPEAVVVYKCTEYYAPQYEHVVRWNDPALGIPWPIANPILSERDAAAPLLSEIPFSQLPRFA